MKLKKLAKMEDHFMKFDAIISDLESTGAKTEDSDKVYHLLLTLYEDYEPGITAMGTLNTEVIMDFVKSRLSTKR